MEPITTWSSDRVSAWLRGLGVSLQQYPLEQWRLSGVDLLQLNPQQLEELGVHTIGHQELILDAVEKLCTLTYGPSGESVYSVAEKLRDVAHSLQMGIQSRWRVNTYDGIKATELPDQELQLVLDLIVAAKTLYSMLNRYQYTELTGYTGFKNILDLCKGLSSTMQKDNTVLDKEKDIISVSRQLVAICDDVLSAAPEDVLSHTPQLQSVDLVPVLPGEQLVIEIASTSSSQHYVSGTAVECTTDSSEKILAGDEVIKVNDQIVVGWSRKNLVAKLQENPNGVTLLLRRLPALPVSHKPKDTPTQVAIKKEEDKEEEESNTPEQQVFERAPTSVRSYSFRAAVLSPEGQELSGQDEPESGDHRLDGNQSLGVHTHHLSTGTGLERRSSSLLSLDSSRARVGSWPDMGAGVEEKEPKKTSFKGTRTAMSRRRVSCRELGLPDCDGWLWKKRKEMSVFMTQKWQRFWFVLKGVTIYWYTSQQEDKAVGMVKIGSYSIESAGEHKRKYVFKMCHPRFQNFFFAADNVTDMSKWINCLITAIQKYKKYQQNQVDSEAECYSETESEEDGSNSPRILKKKPSTKPQSNTLPRSLGRKIKQHGGAAATISPAGGSKVAGTVDEMGELFNKLKEGGVSLIGQNQPVTHDQLRRSFIRRNKNPVINEKVHTLRALQSTLKAKEAELQLLNKLLEDSSLTPLKYRQWKQHNEDLHQEIEKLATEKKRSQATPQAETVPTCHGDGARRLSLSDGEQLVDAELPSDADSAPESGHPHLTSCTDPRSERADSSYSENYFYI
ncbi:connector enhancer of kinase suppressor of ras 1 [Clarias magur]|uniref:Connector enhancer of kinase suppressor of ras 1 n=1 Tax=Clarias magur TaxID=1594786 RepID=A0A8J4TQI7_CLAMG|nr:connector enhancer of kinase suppressor of ras 1 [Clarias magur]